MYKVAKRLASLSFLLCFLSTQFAPALALEGGGWQAKKEASSLPSPQSLPQAQAQPLPANVALDLTSTAALFAANNTAPVEMRVGGFAGGTGVVRGGSRTMVDPNEMLTASQYLALQQLMTTGSQNLIVNDQGAAVGGFVTLTSSHVGDLTSLTVPTGVTMHSIDFNSATPLNVSGAAAVNGSMYALQSTQGQTAVMNFGSLSVGPGGVLSTELPGSATYLSNVYASAGLTASVTGDLHNSGSISTAGNLNLNVGGAIYNQSTSASQAQMAGALVNLYSGAGSFVNSGTIAATVGNLNLASKAATDITINNAGGLLKASGDVNVRDAAFTDQNDLYLLGGQIDGQNLNLYSGCGAIELIADQSSATVNAYAHDVHAGVSGGDLRLGAMEISGDPAFFNTNGNVLVGNFTFSGDDVLIAASQNVLSGAGVVAIDTSGATGGDIQIYAGVNMTVNPVQESGSNDITSTITVTGRSTTGGKVDLVGANPLTTLTSVGTAGDGGTIGIFAFAGTNQDSGTISLPTALTITSGGTGAAGNGKVLLVAEANNVTAISAGSIDTTGGDPYASADKDGAVTIATSRIEFPLGGVVYDMGAFTTPATALPEIDDDGNIVTVSGSLSIGGITANGSEVRLAAGRNVLVDGDIVVDGLAAGTGNGGKVNIASGSLADFSVLFTIGEASGNGVTGSISANADPGSGDGGEIKIQTFGAGGMRIVGATPITADSPMANGGKIELLAGEGGFSIDTGSITARGSLGGGTGDGGEIKLEGKSITLTGGDFTLDVSAVTDGGGGTITAELTDFIRPTTGIFNLFAAGVVTGDGGTISVKAEGANSDLFIGTTPGHLSFDISGLNAGELAVVAGHSVVIDDTAGIVMSPGVNGNGAKLSFEATGGDLLVDGTLDVSGNGSGDGGEIALFGNANFLVDGSLLANGGATGNGGLVEIEIGSDECFTIGTSGVTGSIEAKGGTVSGDGGTFKLTSGGDVDLTAVVNLPDVSAVMGGGGSVSITANGVLSLPGAATISADAVGAGAADDFDGGTIELQGNGIFVVGGNLTLSANGGGIGDGGTVSVKNTNAAFDLTIGAGAGNFTVSAESGAGATGNGGKISFESQRHLTVDPGSFSADPQSTNGNGAELSFIAQARLSVSSDLSADGVGTGDGGKIHVEETSDAVFNIGTTGGVDGALSANAGTDGKGGTIEVENNGRGGINIDAITDLSALSAGTSGGGTISLDATRGDLSLPGGMIDLDASGAGANDGGNFTAKGKSLILGGALTINANGSDTGAGGTVELLSTDSFLGGDITVDASNFIINAQGGAAGGSGGEVTITAGNSLTVDATALTINPQAGNSDGAIVELISGTASAGILTITNPLNLSGLGTGKGGSLTATAQSGDLQIDDDIALDGGAGGAGNDGGTFTASVLNGFLTIAAMNLSASGGGTGASDGGTVSLIGRNVLFTNNLAIVANGSGTGKGGTVSVTAPGIAGSLTVGGAAGEFSIAAQGGGTSGDSGTVTVSAGSDLTVDGSSLMLAPLGANGKGATLALNAGTAGTATMTINNDIDASGVGTGQGGSLTLKSTGNISSDSSLIADGGATGKGGTIKIEYASVTTFALGVASANGIAVGITALGGGTSGDGGEVSILNNGTGAISLANGSNISVAPTVGKGGLVTLDSAGITISAGTLSVDGAGAGDSDGGTLTLISSTSLLVTGNLSANGFDTGSGGTINLTNNVAATTIIGAGVVANGVTGTISANGGAGLGGGGGTIDIAANGAGGLSLTTPGNMTVTPSAAGGAGGTLRFAASAGTMTIAAGATFTVSATVGGDFAGGQIDISAVSLSLPGLVTLLGRGAQNGNGGKAKVTVTGATSDLAIDTIAGTFTVDVASGATGGNGGEVDFSAGRNLTVLTSLAALDARVRGANGTGATLRFAAGTTGTGSLFINGSLNALGFGTNGGGGTIILSSASAPTFNIGAGSLANGGVAGILAATGGGVSGNGGTIIVTNRGAGGITLPATGNINVGAFTGNGGHIELQAPTGALTITAGTLSANAGGTGSGGSVTLNSETMAVTGGPLILTANAVGTGAGGTLKVSTTNGSFNLNVGNGIGNVELFATGAGVGGNGGNITVSAARNLTVDPAFLNAAPTGSGNGEHLILQAGFPRGIGSLTVNGSLDASGVGAGTSAGLIFLNANNTVPFRIGPGGAANGINGTLTATGGGGAIVVTNAGDAVIATPLVFPGSGLTIAVGGSILTAPGATVLNTSSINGNGGSLTLIAGGNPGMDDVNNVRITGPSATGGRIDLATGTAITAIDLTGEAPGQQKQGGFVSMFAFKGSVSSSGTINIPSAVTIETNGRSQADESDYWVGVFSGATGSAAIKMGGVDTAATGFGGGNIKIKVGTLSIGDEGTAGFWISHVDGRPHGLIITTQGTGTGTISTGALLSPNSFIDISGLSNVLITGNVNAGSGNFDGGKIKIVSNSNTPFIIGTGATTNGVIGSLNTQADVGTGGAIEITNSGAGGVNINSTVLDADGASGGGSITINSSLNALKITTSTLSANSANGDGGTITINAQSIAPTGVPGAVLFTADGGTFGDGGKISITSTSNSKGIVVGGLANQLVLSALGVGGNGGEITISSGQDLTFDPLFATAAPNPAGNGDGASFSLTAPGKFLVSGSLMANGTGTGDGGKITISASSTTVFRIGSVSNHGVTGILTATGVNGGSISVTSSSNNGIQLASTANILVTAAAGNGGEITLSASTGTLVTPAGILSANGAGSVCCDGGTINLTFNKFQVTGGVLALQANGAGSGNGGTINVTSAGNITIGAAVGNLTVSATGGSALSVSGDGGKVNLNSGGKLTITTGSLNANPLGTNGKGAEISLTSTDHLSISAGLSANGGGAGGLGRGDGGKITINANSATLFTVGAAGNNATGGILSATGGAVDGAGGSVTISTNTASGITLTAFLAIAVNPTNGKGGTISLTGGALGLNLPSGTMSVNAAGLGDFDGGTLSLTGSPLTFGAGALTLNANAVGNGNGGSVTVSNQHKFGDLTLGGLAGQITINARGGSVLGLFGNGGKVTLSAGRHVTVDPAFLDADTLSTNGDGSQLNFTAGTKSNGNLFIAADLHADAVGDGKGGIINLTSNNKTTGFTIGGATVNGTAGVLTALGGGATGDGGTIVVNSTTATAGIILPLATNISVDPTQGSGGTITLNSGLGSMTIGTAAPLSANAQGIGNGLNGGTISLTATFYNIAGTALVVGASAPALGSGKGGTINITTTNNNTDLAIGGAAGQFTLFAAGTSQGETNAGDGGTVNLTSARHISVNPGFLTAGPLGVTGKGAQLTFTAGGSGTGNVLISAALNISGLGLGDGGSLTVTTKSNTAFVIGTPAANGIVGGINASSGMLAGAGGSVSVTNGGSGGITLSNSGVFTMTAASGKGGSITLAAGTGNINVTALVGVPIAVNAGGTGAGEGGTITFTSKQLVLTGAVGLALSANGAGTGNGGKISLTTTGTGATGNLNIGGAIGQLSLSATGGTAGRIPSVAGDGGTITLAAGAGLIMNTAFLTVDPLGVNGKGAMLDFTSTADTLITGTLDVSGTGSGNGGDVKITTKSNNKFEIGGPVVKNGIVGNVISLGVKGGAISFYSNGQTVNAGAEVLSISISPAFDGTAGTILFSKPSGSTGGLTTNINGTANAFSPSNFSGGNQIVSAGIVGFNNGPNGRVVVKGTGVIRGGRSADFGNLDTTTLLPLGTPAGTVNVQVTTLNVGITLAQNAKTFTQTSAVSNTLSDGEAVVDTGDITDDDDAGSGELASGM